MSAPTTAAPRTAARRAARLIPEPGPGRTLYWATLVNTVGSGMYITSSAIFFVRYLGLSAGRVGLALSAGGLIGLAAGLPAGRLADRRGPRDVFVGALLVQALAMALLVYTRSLWLLTADVTVAGLALTAAQAARGPLIRAAAAEGASILRAHLRAVANLGLTLGGSVGGLFIALDDRSLYPVLIWANAASYVLCAALGLRLPGPSPAAPRAAAAGERGAVLRDRHYLGITGVSLVMMLQVPVLPLVLPLWIYAHTALPHWLVAAAIPINTLMVAGLQMRITRGVDGTLDAARLMPRAGLAFLAGFALFAVIGGLPVWAGAAALVIAVGLYTLGEILHGTSSYELSLNLAPSGAVGAYYGVYTTGSQLGRAVSSGLVSVLCLDLGAPGWILLGALMTAAGLVTPAIARRALAAAAAVPGAA